MSDSSEGREPEEALELMPEAAPEGLVLEYALAADDAGLGFFEYFHAADHLEANDRFYGMFSMARGGALREWLARFDAPSREAALALVARGTLGGETFSLELRLAGPESARRFVVTGRSYGAGGSRRIVGVARDVSAERAALEEAREAARIKGDFLSTMSHELRTPLNAIVGLAHLLGESGLQGEAGEMVGKIAEASRLLVGIVSDTLDMAALDSGRISVERSPFDPRRSVAAVASIVEHEAIRKGLDLRLAAAPSVPARCYGDSFRLEQAVLNLVANAIKFTDSGSVSIDLDYDAGSAPGVAPGGVLGGRTGLLTCEVSDTGIGFDDATAARLFTPFSQADSSTRRRYGGTGLGLAISLGIARALGGDLRASSIPGKGSVFTLTVPLDPAPLPEADPPGSARSVAAVASGERPLILIVEDEELNRSILRRILEIGGYDVAEADSGQAAVSLASAGLREGRLSCVVMDIQMPLMDGYEATVAIRATPGLERLPVIALSGNVTGRAQAFESGMDGFLAKPVDPRTLLSAIAELTERYEPERLDGGELPPSEAVGAVKGATRDLSAAAQRMEGDEPAAYLPEALLEALGGDRETLRSLELRFVSSYAGAAEELRGLSGKALSLRAHALRGAAASMRMPALAAAAAAIERAAGEEDGSREDRERLLAEFERALGEALRMLGRRSAGR